MRGRILVFSAITIAVTVLIYFFNGRQNETLFPAIFFGLPAARSLYSYFTDALSGRLAFLDRWLSFIERQPGRFFKLFESRR
ncbi:MAG: hypothetical protein AAGG07_04985 [Planctomycetota bacterium]